MIVQKVLPEEWDKIAQKVHLISFNEVRPAGFNRYSFALVVTNETDIVGYMTVIEMDGSCAYMQHGGAMPPTKDTIHSKRAYKMMIEWLKQHYSRMSTRILNTNIVMLKFAMSEGLVIDGVIAYGKEVFLSLGWGFQDA